MIVPNPWVTWFKAASLPALVCLLLTQLILYKLYPPEIKDTLEAPALATKKLDSMILTKFLLIQFQKAYMILVMCYSVLYVHLKIIISTKIKQPKELILFIIVIQFS